LVFSKGNGLPLLNFQALINAEKPVELPCYFLSLSVRFSGTQEPKKLEASYMVWANDSTLLVTFTRIFVRAGNGYNYLDCVIFIGMEKRF